MNRAKALQEIQDLIGIVVKHSDFSLTEATTAKDIKGWDSLSHMAIMAEIEKHFGVNFSFMDIINMTDIGSLLDCLQDKL